MSTRTVIRNLSIGLVSAAVLSACATGGSYVQSDPYGNPTQQQNRTGKGALIGTAIGVAAGLLSGDNATERRQRAMVGARLYQAVYAPAAREREAAPRSRGVDLRDAPRPAAAALGVVLDRRPRGRPQRLPPQAPPLDRGRGGRGGAPRGAHDGAAG